MQKEKGLPASATPKALQAGVSTLILIIVIIAVAIIAVGGVFAYQYFATKTQPVVQTQQNQNQNTNQTTQPSITVTSQNSGETLTQGQTYNITWQSNGVASIGIELFDMREGAGRNSDLTIATSVSASPSTYSWTIPVQIPTDSTGLPLITMPGNKYQIQIYDKSNPNTVQGYSSNYFSVVAQTNQTAGWKTYANTQYGFEFQYPENLSPTYNFVSLNKPEVITDINNSPTINSDGCFTGNNNYPNPIKEDEKISINNNQFCLSETGDAAMGHNYTTYFYTTHKNNNYFTVVLAFGEQKCGNLMGGPNYQLCLDFFNNFNLKNTANEIISTFKFTK